MSLYGVDLLLIMKGMSTNFWPCSVILEYMNRFVLKCMEHDHKTLNVLSNRFIYATLNL